MVGAVSQSLSDQGAEFLTRDHVPVGHDVVIRTEGNEISERVIAVLAATLTRDDVVDFYDGIEAAHLTLEPISFSGELPRQRDVNSLIAKGTERILACPRADALL